MRRPLFWRLWATVAVGSVALFWGITHVATHTEEVMSHIAPEHQRTLLGYGARAEALFAAGDEAALAAWIDELQVREQTWAAVVRADVSPLAGSTLTERFRTGFRLGRDVAWKIHLYFAENPIMEVGFGDGATRFLMQLPARMRPGDGWTVLRLLIHLLLPSLLLLAVCVWLYRHLMRPLTRLENAARAFSEGRYEVRAAGGAGRDELARVAAAFDGMAERTGQLIVSQRQRLADLSHELRTPLTRIDMALSLAGQREGSSPLLDRIRDECGAMRRLVEDALTLSWLETESPALRDEVVDLTALLDSIVDDARFEYPDRRLDARIPPDAVLHGSSHRALAQAIENVVRNALGHTPPGGRVVVCVRAAADGFDIDVSDEGPGVPGALLERIFQPFFRVTGHGADVPAGFGLGLALARRQLEATGGKVFARNRCEGGLMLTLQLPGAGSGAP